VVVEDVVTTSLFVKVFQITYLPYFTVHKNKNSIPTNLNPKAIKFRDKIK
jgi:hypothetical protein